MFDSDQVRIILESGDLSALVGRFESGILECKRQPYRLDTDEQKLELAKDVSALANGKGGVILIGYATTLDPSHGEDCIDSVRMFDRSLVDVQRYAQVLADWLWPPVHNLQIRWYEAQDSPGRGVVAIFVPRAEGLDRPVLIAKTVLDGVKRGEIVFGYCERRLARVHHHSVQRLQALLRDGNRLDEELRDGLQGLQTGLAQLHSGRLEIATAAERRALMDEKLSDAARSVDLDTLPAYVLAAMPQRLIDIPALFESRHAPVARLIDNPPEIRQSGFDLSTGEASRIIAGRLRRSLLIGYKILELHRDGTLIFIMRGDDALCWGRQQRQQDGLLINQLCMIETALLFAKLASDVYREDLTAEDTVQFHLRLLRMKTGARPCWLEPGSLQSFSFTVQEAPDESGLFSIQAKAADTPRWTALRLIREVYAWFGFEEDRIPYTTKEPRGIDEGAIAAIR